MTDENDLPPAPTFGFGETEPLPPRTPEHLICLRGPCRYYWHTLTTMDAGNPHGTWEALGIPTPRRHNHVCLRSFEEFDFSDDHVFECSQWDPMQPLEIALRKTRREAYLSAHPECRPVTAAELMPEENEDDKSDDSASGADSAS